MAIGAALDTSCQSYYETLMPCNLFNVEKNAASIGASIGAGFGSKAGPIGAGVGAGFGAAGGYIAGALANPCPVSKVLPDGGRVPADTDRHETAESAPQVNDATGDHPQRVEIPVTQA